MENLNKGSLDALYTQNEKAFEGFENDSVNSENIFGGSSALGGIKMVVDTIKKSGGLASAQSLDEIKAIAATEGFTMEIVSVA